MTPPPPVLRKILSITPLRWGNKFHVNLECGHLQVKSWRPVALRIPCQTCSAELLEYWQNGKITVTAARRMLDREKGLIK